ncbi:MAG: DUF5687 family protein [Prevotellaceae bacterium]|nr:DUF5687 family protein [Prevotellaceae bacterium]
MSKNFLEELSLILFQQNMRELIRIYLLSIRRHLSFYDKLATKILSCIGFGYITINLIVAGFFLDRFLMLIEPTSVPIDTFSRFFLFLFVIDIILKFFLKSYKHIDVLPFLTLPIPRKKIYILLFIKELLSGWNFIWVVMLTPFFFKTFDLFNLPLLIFSVYLVSITISFIMRYIEIMSTWKSFLFTFLSLLLAVCAGYTAYYVAVYPELLIDINLIFSQYQLWAFIGLLLLFSGLFIVFFKSCRTELYAQLTSKKRLFSTSFNINLFNNLSLKGEIVKLCLKEVTRSQLKRNMFSFVLLVIGSLLMLYGTEVNFFMLCFILLMPTIILGSTFGDYSFGAESTFFDKLMVAPEKTPYLILKIKYVICIFFSALVFIIHIALNINKIPILFYISIFFFGCGIVLFFIFQNVVYNKERFDILGSVRNIVNYSLQSFMSVGLIMLSLGIIFLIKLFTSETTANYVMLATGIVMTALSPFWLKNIYNRFLIRKYQNINGFRNT